MRPAILRSLHFLHRARRYRTALLVCMAVAAAAASINAAWPAGASGGRSSPAVVFDRQQRRGTPKHDIYSSSANGTSEQRLTLWAGDEQTPQFSPDGQRIAFRAAAGLESASDIWIMNADGTNKRNLTRSPHLTEWSPTWTRDGRSIVFSCSPEHPGVGNDLCIMRADGTQRRYLMTSTARSEEYPSFDPSGRNFVFISYSGSSPFQVWVANSDGTRARLLAGSPAGDTWPRWAPDGKHIAWKRGDDIWVMRSDGTQKRDLTRTPGVNEQFPAWLPDGRLSFVRGRNSEASYGLWRTDQQLRNPKLVIPHVSGWAYWNGT